MSTILSKDDNGFRLIYRGFIFKVRPPYTWGGIKKESTRSEDYTIEFEKATGVIILHEALIKELVKDYQKQIRAGISLWCRQFIDGQPYAGLDLPNFLDKLL